jgi:8-oxo-dGTP pyrophosphatase MutT (NUDIX family)
MTSPIHKKPFGPDEREWLPVYANNWFSVLKKGRWHKLDSTNGLSGAAAFIMDVNEHVLLIENYQNCVDRITLEIPRGGSEDGETLAETASRELLEEAALRIAPEDLDFLGSFHPDSGLVSGEKPIFFAKLCVEFPEMKAQESEGFVIRTIPFDDLGAMIAAGVVKDSFTTFSYAILLAKKAADKFDLESKMCKDIEKKIKILNADGGIEVEIDTSRPAWSFDQCCRNRETVGWSWEFA